MSFLAVWPRLNLKGVDDSESRVCPTYDVLAYRGTRAKTRAECLENIRRTRTGSSVVEALDNIGEE